MVETGWPSQKTSRAVSGHGGFGKPIPPCPLGNTVFTQKEQKKETGTTRFRSLSVGGVLCRDGDRFGQRGERRQDLSGLGAFRRGRRFGRFRGLEDFEVRGDAVFLGGVQLIGPRVQSCLADAGFRQVSVMVNVATYRLVASSALPAAIMLPPFIMAAFRNSMARPTVKGWAA